MASVGSVTSSVNSLKGYGGLASGLDRDTLIEQMTYATRAKIAKQEQNLQLLQWEQEGIRNISDKIYDFLNNFTSFSSSKNLTSSLLFSRGNITAIGENSKYVSVSGKATSGNTFSILGIKQLAQDAQLTTSKPVSDRVLATGNLAEDLKTEGIEYNTVVGDSIRFDIGNESYNVKILAANEETGKEFDFSTVEGLEEALNYSLSKTEGPSGKNLSEYVEFNAESDGTLSISNKISASGTNIKLGAGTGNVLVELGFLDEDNKFTDKNGNKVDLADGISVDQAKAEKADVFDISTYANLLGGKSITFSYNGTIEKITLAEADKLNTINDLVSDIQGKLDDAFGKGRIEVTVNAENGLEFRTVDPSAPAGDNADNSSVLKITSADSGLLGETGILGIKSGESNRLNLNGTLAEAGLANFENLPAEDPIMGTDEEGNETVVGQKWLTINGKTIEGITADSTISEIMEAINSDPDADVTISYQEASDKFIMTSKDKGASGKIEVSGVLADIMFGTNGDGYTVQEGQDAKVAVQYAGDNAPTEIIRDSNGFTIDGIDVALKGTFGYVNDGNGGVKLDTNAEPITFEASVDSEKTTEVVKEMIDAFNEILTTVNTELTTKPDNDYAPLTDEQREEMTESQIEKWEEKAKEGLFFNDSDFRSFSSALRFVLPMADRAELAEIGITVSSEYEDNGKLVFDEEAFKAALEKDPEKVRELFAGDGTDENPGFMEGIKSVMEQYGKTTGATKGIFVERAGSVHAPTSVLDNSILTEMDSVNDVIDRLKNTLENEQDRYIKQFTTLETLISQMNSQSSYLSSMFTSGY